MSENNPKRGFKIDDYPWIRERDELIEREERRRKDGYYGELDMHGQRKDILHRAHIDEVLKFARFARNHPDIWPVIMEIAERGRKDPDAEMYYDEMHFLNFFRDWYMMKNELPYSILPFHSATGLLLQVASGKISDIDSKEARDLLLTNSAIYENCQ